MMQPNVTTVMSAEGETPTSPLLMAPGSARPAQPVRTWLAALGSGTQHDSKRAFADVMLLVRCARVWPVVVLVVLAAVEAMAVSKAGKAASKFYQIFVDEDLQQFKRTLLDTTMLYGSVCAIIAVSYLIGQMLVISWRRNIAHSLHLHYFHSCTFFCLQVPATNCSHWSSHSDLKDERESHTWQLNGQSAVTASHSHAWQASLPPLDNPDQRMTEDVQLFCVALERICQQSAKSPFNLVLFSWLTVQTFGSVMPLIAALAFFCAFALLHGAAAKMIASNIYGFTRCEGDLRSAHMRVRTCAAAIAAWGGAGVEQAQVDERLSSVLSAQLKLALACAVQTLVKQVWLHALATSSGCCSCMSLQPTYRNAVHCNMRTVL